MRVIVLRKQDMTGELPEEVQEAARQALVEKIRQLLNEVETNLEGMSIEELEDLLRQLGGERKLLRKGEVTIIPESILEALNNLVEAVGELASRFPALGEEEAEELLEVVKKIETNLSKIKEQLQEGTTVIEEELRKQLEEEEEKELYSPGDVIKRESEKIQPIEGLVFSLKEEMASLKRVLDDIEDNADLLAIPGERDVFIEEGWFHRKVRSIRSHILEIAEMGMELVRRLAELGGVEIKEPWKR